MLQEQRTLETKDTKRVSLEPRIEGREVIIGTDLITEEEEELVNFHRKNKDVFAWSAADLKGVSRTIIEHKLNIDPKTKQKNKNFRKC